MSGERDPQDNVVVSLCSAHREPVAGCSRCAVRLPVGLLHGYRRNNTIRRELLDTIEAALDKHPTMRLGQIIVNATTGTPVDLFNLYDETLIDALEAF